VILQSQPSRVTWVTRHTTGVVDVSNSGQSLSCAHNSPVLRPPASRHCASWRGACRTLFPAQKNIARIRISFSSLRASSVTPTAEAETFEPQQRAMPQFKQKIPARYVNKKKFVRYLNSWFGAEGYEYRIVSLPNSLPRMLGCGCPMTRLWLKNMAISAGRRRGHYYYPFQRR
jgi:hypothetical protein